MAHAYIVKVLTWSSYRAFEDCFWFRIPGGIQDKGWSALFAAKKPLWFWDFLVAETEKSPMTCVKTEGSFSKSTLAKQRTFQKAAFVPNVWRFSCSSPAACSVEWRLKIDMACLIPSLKPWIQKEMDKNQKINNSQLSQPDEIHISEALALCRSTRTSSRPPWLTSQTPSCSEPVRNGKQGSHWLAQPRGILLKGPQC